MIKYNLFNFPAILQEHIGIKHGVALSSDAYALVKRYATNSGQKLQVFLYSSALTTMSTMLHPCDNEDALSVKPDMSPGP